MRPYRILLSPDAGEGNDGTTAAATSNGKPDESVALLLKKQAELERELAEVKKDNADVRKRNRALKEERDSLRDSASVPADIEAELSAYRALGKPEELKATAAERAELRREKEIASAGKVAGVRPEKLGLLARLTPPTAKLLVEQEKRDGKDVEVVYVQDGDGKPVPFDAYAAYADARDSLFPDAKEAPRGTPRRDFQSPPPPPLDGAGGDRTGDPRDALVRSGRYQAHRH